MESKKLIWLGMSVGGFLGGFLPALWGAGDFSFSSIICSALGAVVGIWIAFRLSY